MEIGGEGDGGNPEPEHALKYWQHINQYIQDKGITGIRALVAFSGDLQLDGVGGVDRSKATVSPKPSCKQFDTDEYQLLVVAEIPDSFDQPKLAAMYVDRRLSGLQAV